MFSSFSADTDSIENWQLRTQIDYTAPSLKSLLLVKFSSESILAKPWGLGMRLDYTWGLGMRLDYTWGLGMRLDYTYVALFLVTVDLMVVYPRRDLAGP